jgi:hypothetical protein
LLSEYERESNGKIKLTRITEFSPENANAALAAGIRPINLDKGDGCYLGIVVVDARKKASLVQISEQWESAVEADLSRSLASLDSAAPAASSPAVATVADASAVHDLLQSNPELASASLEEGTQMLRAAALVDFASAVKEMRAQLDAAEQKFKDAQSANSEPGQAAARAELQRIPADQSAKLALIGSRLEKQIDAFRQYKSSAQ